MYTALRIKLSSRISITHVTSSSKNGTLCNYSTYEIITLKDYGSLRTCRIWIWLLYLHWGVLKLLRTFARAMQGTPMLFVETSFMVQLLKRLERKLLLTFALNVGLFWISNHCLTRLSTLAELCQDVEWSTRSQQAQFIMTWPNRTIFWSSPSSMVKKITCITEIAFVGISNQRLSRLRRGIQIETQDSTEFVQKENICTSHRFSDVILPRNCEQPAQTWLESQPDDVPIRCKKHPIRHGNARKPSNHASSGGAMERFLAFIDNNSASNGRKEVQGKHSILTENSPKFVLLTKKTPNTSTSVATVFGLNLIELWWKMALIRYLLGLSTIG